MFLFLLKRLNFKKSSLLHCRLWSLLSTEKKFPKKKISWQSYKPLKFLVGMLKTAKKFNLANQLIELIESLCKISRLFLRSSDSGTWGTLFLAKKVRRLFYTDSINSINWFSKLNILSVFNIPCFKEKISIFKNNIFSPSSTILILLNKTFSIWISEKNYLKT
jgi:hypothetical protein